MALFRIFRIKDSLRQQFRWAPHTSGISTAKPKDYEQVEELEAPTPYALWTLMKATSGPLNVGDILESDTGELRIYKYVGFEEAQWLIPETKVGPEAAPVIASIPNLS